MKYYAVLAAVLIVLAGLAFFAYYDNSLREQKVPSGSHVYLGAVYGGVNEQTNFISASLNFDKGSNLYKNLYYVVLSIWDSNKSYDQIGITSYYGSFYSTYSYTEMVNGSIKYKFTPTWFPISPGIHTISMNASQGTVTFTFDGTNYLAYTGGEYFSISANEVIGNHSFSGLTVYEEMYGFNKSLPGISFNFSKVNFGTTGYPTGPITDWVHFSHNLTANYSSTVYIKGGIVNITNIPPQALNVSIESPQSSGIAFPYTAVSTIRLIY